MGGWCEGAFIRSLGQFSNRKRVPHVGPLRFCYAACRSATVTTFQPLTDTTYIPCVSLLDFWIPEDALELVVYAHSLDFGKKAYGNLVELAHLQEHVARELGRPVGPLVVHAKSAHVYEPEWALMAGLVEARVRAVTA